MQEYIFKTATNEELQKWLNQWKHKYEIEILKIHVHKLDTTTIYIIRTPKQNKS
jgi:type II secretory pathway component PulM